MATANRRQRSSSPPATDESSSRKPLEATASSSLYFPPELIPQIARRLTSLQDFFALRAACSAYRAVLPLTSSNLASQEPLLLVPQTGGAGRALFHLSLRRLLRFRLPCDEIYHTRFHSLGCLVGIYDNNRGTTRHEVRIAHLLTGERAPIPSPPSHFNRVRISGDLALAWNEESPIIQYRLLEAADWRLAYISDPYLLRDLICVNGTTYALVTPGYRLLVVGLFEDPIQSAFLGGELDAHIRGQSSVICFAECRGDLLLITTSLRQLYFQFEFRVYRWQAAEEKWARITGLDGCTLFLVDHHFVACLGPDHPGVRGDCIYSTFPGSWCEFSLVDGSYALFEFDYPGATTTYPFHQGRSYSVSSGCGRTQKISTILYHP